ncbi:hypothetical protein BHU61_00500 [Macrococcus epidermidis]|uniref:Uncharacterized protein n=1 Tax=Macrococcus epidermidis TaxID=1902580 RepID=A0A327ZUT1_9STAP|nr:MULTISPECIES: hypothetical protein [Macrococcus]MCG7419626.1 hypothetical protein [Macrococcus epidermidis]MCH4984446.1 hypothetical protein [Macrococcus sp. PK]MCH4985153.1 hypothetical protein [Macrococcus sp. PK]RAK45959.1 hypothetical protein BHU61_00500 [Macrococcus epidermidis]UTH16755.1 hypothetical protein KFV12_03000 [Macrococcus epidermidis]
MISWYIKHNKKFYITSMVGLIIVACAFIFIYYPKYTLFAVYAFTMMLLICYADTITQIKRYLETNKAKEWLVAQWYLKDCITYSIVLSIIIGLGYIVIHLSPPNIPGSNMHYTTIIMFILYVLFKWLRYYELRREMKEEKTI